MSKHQEALNELKEFIHSELDGTRMLDKYLGYIEDLKELVDQTQTPTIEEVKKEWEELGYEWIEINLYIRLIQNKVEWKGYTTEIYIDKGTKTYCCFNEETEDDYLYIGPLEHRLLTKTFRALGWEV